MGKVGDKVCGLGEAVERLVRPGMSLAFCMALVGMILYQAQPLPLLMNTKAVFAQYIILICIG